MTSDIQFETFLLVSPKKFSILVIRESDLQKVYYKEIELSNNLNEINFNELNNFLDENIFKIEKILKSFIKNTFLIIDCNDFFHIDISIKKNNFGNNITNENLTYILNEAKDSCKKTLEKKKIVHLIIENYIIDEKQFSHLPKKLQCRNLSLDLKFICIPIDLTKSLEQMLKKYQISLKRIVSMNYIKKFVNEEKSDVYNLSKKIVQGTFENEVLLVNKNTKNHGFFERFFNFFS